ncbi:DUF1015 domain-containing protein [Candidatus Pyrohabitans sp.]
MVLVKPFRGVRYNTAKVEISRVVTPPYDVISAEERERYYAAHRYNIIRLDYNRGEGEEKYREAARLYRQWRESQILIREKKPSLYYCRQDYEIKGERKALRGLIALVKLSEYSAGEVLPHEETLSSPKEDRLALLRHTKANFSQIYGLYEDREAKVTEMVEGELEEPIVDFCDGTGRRHRLWRISDEGVIEAVVRAFFEKRIYIADGHHRYETALAYRNEMRRLTGRCSGEEPFDYTMMFLANLYDEGVTILPAHRAIKQEFSKEEFLARAEEYFDIKSFGRDGEALFRFLYSDKRNFGFYRDEFYGLALKDFEVMDRLLEAKPPVLRRLSVSVLHSLILERILGFRGGEGDIAYIIDEEEAVAGVDRGEFTAAFFLNPTRVEEIREVALAGERMPGKATYFYPKLLTGLVLYDMEE